MNFHRGGGGRCHGLVLVIGGCRFLRARTRYIRVKTVYVGFDNILSINVNRSALTSLDNAVLVQVISKVMDILSQVRVFAWYF